MNTYNKFSDIEKILTSDKSLDNEQKMFFKALAGALADRQSELFDVLQKNTIGALKNTPNINPVATILSTDTTDDIRGFFPMLADDEEENIVFIDIPVETLKEEYEYSIDGSQLKFERITDFVEKEQMISSIFKAYNICQPCIFSPYARHAYRAYIFDEKKDDFVALNIRKNNICNKIENVIQGRLLWNIEVCPLSQFRALNVVVNDIEFVRFENCDDNTFIYFSAEDNAAIITKSAKSQYIDIRKDNYEEYLPQLKKVIIHTAGPCNARCYMNISDQSSPIPERIVSEADMYLAVQKFYPEPTEFKGLLEEKNNNAIKEYNKEYRYIYEELSPTRVKNKVFYYLKFENSGKDNLFADRVNFFISFMRYNYPNFYWVGVQ